MSIRVQCKKCRGQFAAREELAGRLGKCPTCKALIRVPAARPGMPAHGAAQMPRRRKTMPAAEHAAAAQTKQTEPTEQTKQTERPARPVRQDAPRSSVSSAPSAATRAALATQLSRAFRGDIPRVRVSLLYRFGILLTAIMMVLLPIGYLAVIALSATGVYYHTVHHTWLAEMGTGRGRLVMVGVYVGPIVAGAILVLFMLKPLFARPGAARRMRSLSRRGEPVLFAFVDRICQAVGAKPPVRIEVNCELNASASLDRTVFKLVRNRLVLTIGVPLVAGLDASQFAGVLAHEFGHFTQGAGMRLTYVIRSINYWLVRVVYQRDTWDEWLEDTAAAVDFRIGWVLQLSRIAVFLSRSILWLFMIVGHVVSSFMLRQMEFHADAHEARLVGSKTFESTTRQLGRLDVAYQAATSDVQRFAGGGRLADNLPRLMLARAGAMRPAVLEALDTHLSTVKTGWFDSHPAPSARIRRAKREADSGVFADARPAAELFSNFAELARGVTWDMYRGVFGSRFQPAMMHPTDELLEQPARKPAPPREIPLD